MWKWILGGTAVLWFLTRKTTSQEPKAGSAGPTTTPAAQMELATLASAIMNHIEEYYRRIQETDVKASLVFADGAYSVVVEGSKQMLAGPAKTLDELQAQVVKAFQIPSLGYGSYEAVVYI